LTDQASRSELRKFGLTVGTAFAVFGSLSWWRGHAVAPWALSMLALALVAPAVIAPLTLGRVQRIWMRAALALGRFNTRLILTLVFYALIAPVGLVLRRFRDPLDRALDDGRRSHWVKRDREPFDATRYEQQF